MQEKTAAIRIVEQLPTPGQYNALRKAVGWRCIDPQRSQTALDSSHYTVCAIHRQQVIGCGRVIGDGIYYYIQDVIILPQYQKQGLGYQIMDKLMHYLDHHAPEHSGVFIGLMSAPGIEKFYAKYGFDPLAQDSPFMFSRKN